MKKVKVKGEERTAKARKPKMPIWKTARHSSEVQAKIVLPHVVDAFTAQHLMADALPSFCGVISLEVKYVIFPDYGDARKLSDQCWGEYMAKKGGAK